MCAVLAKSFYTVVLLLLVACPMALSWRSFKLIFTGCDYEFNSNYLDVKLQIQNDTESSLNLVVNTYDTLDDVYLSVVISFENELGNRTALLNRTVNFCKLLKQRSTEPLLRMLYDDLLRHGKLIKECPIRKGTYSLHEYRVDEETLPSYLPETSFVVTIALTMPKNIELYRGNIYGRIDKSKGFDNLKMFSLG